MFFLALVLQMFDLSDPFPEEDIDVIRNCCGEFIYELLQSCEFLN